ncbi:MAG: segregation/condensation protein A [Phycisphaerae bacterium]|nr:segregation/condensation protein A [Phycisphaerae bacterium]
MADYRVNLDIFAGPMDLLLYLVRREEVDIYDIPISEITEQYIRYIEMLQSLDIDLAGDFLVMASTLLQIKSAMLLPKTEDEAGLGGEDLTDPRAELIRQLLEYKKFKDAANLLCAAADETNKRFARPAAILEQLKPGEEPEVDLEQLSVWDLLEAFGSIIEATGGVRFDVSHIKDDTPIDLYQIEILHRLQTEGAMSFERIFEGRKKRIVMIGLFLAILELVREKLVGAEQYEGTINLRPLTEENAEQAVQKAIFTLAEAEAEANNEQAVEVEQDVEASHDVEAKPEKPPIPIAELPAKGHRKASEAEYEKVESANEPQAEN